MYRHGKIIDKTIYDDNRYEIEDNDVKIYLYDSKGNEIGFTLIDLEDLDKVKFDLTNKSWLRFAQQMDNE